MTRYLWSSCAALVVSVFVCAVPASAQRYTESSVETLTRAGQCRTVGIQGMGRGSWDVKISGTAQVSFYVVGAGGTQNAVDVAKADTPATFVNTATATGVWAGDVASYAGMRTCLDSITAPATVSVVMSAAGTGGGGGGSGGSGGEVTNGGTFVVQENGAALTALQLIDDALRVEDAAETAGTGLVMIGCVRRDTAASSAGTTGDNATCNTDATGNLWTIETNSATIVTNTDRTADNLDTLLLTAAVDATIDNAIPASGPLIIGRASTATPTAVSADGDAQAIWIDLNGRVVIKGSNAEDVASANGDAGVVAFAIRDDTLDVRSGTEGDFEYLHTNANGALWAIDVNSAAALTALQLIDDTVFTDDAAFTPATSKGLAIGAQADDTSTDSVDEGDFGALRISLDRLLYTRQADPCSGGATKLYLPFDITTATTTEITPSLAGASTHYYICAFNILSQGANSVNLVDDNTDGCGSVTASLISSGLAATDGWYFAANGGMVGGNGAGAVMRTQTSNSVLCLVTSAATELHGQFVVVAAP